MGIDTLRGNPGTRSCQLYHTPSTGHELKEKLSPYVTNQVQTPAS